MGNQLDMPIRLTQEEHQMQFEAVREAEALKLTAGERSAFAQILLASLDEDADIEKAWAVETERRIADIESGAAQGIPIANALAQVRAALK